MAILTLAVKVFRHSRRALLKTPEEFSGPKNYFMCRLFTKGDSIVVRGKG